MATYDFTLNAGGEIPFDPENDLLVFTSGYSAADLQFLEFGGDLLVMMGDETVTLLGLNYTDIDGGCLNFANNTVFRVGNAGADTLTGSAGDDYIDARQGGNDSISGGDGGEVIIVGSSLTADDTIAGGNGALDDLHVWDDIAVTFNATTVTGIERFYFGTGGALQLTLHQDVFTTATGTVSFDSTGQGSTDGVGLDASMAASDFLYLGGMGTDYVTAGSGNDTLDGGDGTDSLAGGDGHDLISAGAGNDTIDGGAGRDTIHGGTGDDRFIFAWNDSTFADPDTLQDFGDGSDRLVMPTGSDDYPTLFNAAAATFDPTSPSAYIGATVGDGLADVFWRFNATDYRLEVWIDGNDDGIVNEGDFLLHLDSTTTLRTTLGGGDFEDDWGAYRGGFGNDFINGGISDTLLLGWFGNDTLQGSVGDDTLFGGGGNDSLSGDADDDILYADDQNGFYDDSFSSNTLSGGGGNDFLFGSLGNDRLFGNDDNDEMLGDAGNDSIDGGNGDDVLGGGAGVDTLIGGAGNDQLFAGENGGADFLNGGAGNDTLFGAYADSTAQLTGGSGIDTFFIGDVLGNYGLVDIGSSVPAPMRITDFDAVNEMIATGHTRGVDGYGSALVWRGTANVGFTATIGQSLALAGATADNARFNEFWTFYNAGTNRTVLFVDRNHDFTVDAFDLRIEFNGNIALSAANFSVGTFTAVFGTNGDDTDTTPGLTNGDDLAFGLDGNDNLDAFDGVNFVSGDGGNDTLHGGNDLDHLYGGAGNDSLLGHNGESVLYGGSGSDTILGGDDGDVLYAGGWEDSNNALNATDAAVDTNFLLGGAGADSGYGGLGNDTIYGNTGNDWLVGDGGDDYLAGGDDDDLIEGGAGSDVLAGDLGNDTLVCVTGNDTLPFADFYNGSDGDDTFRFDGEAPTGGTHAFFGGIGADTYDFSFGGGTLLTSTPTVASDCTIQDFDAAQGDIINTGITLGEFAGVSLVWRGASGGGFTGAIGQTLASAGSSDTRFLEFFTGYDSGLNRTFVFCDRNRDGVADSGDLRLYFFGLVNILPTWFSAGTFLVGGGSVNDDTNVFPVFTSGNDSAFGFNGNDTFDGLAGDDILNGDFGTDSLLGNDGNDSLFGGAGNDVANGGNDVDDIFGGAGSDTLSGNAGNDQLAAEGHDDSLDTFYGVDAVGTLNYLYGGTGDDVLAGGNGNDRLFGENDADGLFGGGGADSLDGGAGDDTQTGGAGNDTLVGGAGADILEYDGNGTDFLNGGLDNDRLVVYARGNTQLTGGGGADIFHFGNYSTQTILDAGSNVSAALRITDFNAGQGDIIETNISDGFSSTLVPLVWRGTALVGFTATVGQSLTLAGSNTANLGMVEFWTFYDAGANKTVLFCDRDRDFVVDADDLRIEFTGNIPLSPTAFWAGTFRSELYSDGGESIGGDNTSEVILAIGGNDTINAHDGSDVLYGGRGDDSILAGSGADSAFGGAGNDLVEGGDDNDSLFGGSGSDTVYGGAGNDELYAASWEDGYGANADDTPADANLIAGDDGNDYITSLYGNDTLDGGGDQDTLYGLYGHDFLLGGSGDDDLYAGEGNDTLVGGAGVDEQWGDTGDDRVTYDSDDTVVHGGDGNDTLVLLGSAVVSLVDLDQVLGGGLASGFEHVEAFDASGAVTLTGSADANLLQGSAFNDSMLGLNGNDTLDGGLGTDTLAGGKFDDAYFLSSAADLVVENLDEGTDFVLTTFAGNYVLAANVENARVLSSGTAGLFGNGLDNWLYAGTGNNVLNGGAGTDTVSYTAMTAGVTVSLAVATAQATGGSGSDTLASIENLEATQYNDAITGSGLANVLWGLLGNDTLSGAGGNDTLVGDDGIDSLDGGTGTDSLVGGNGNDTYVVDASTDVVLETSAAGGSDLVLSSAASFVLGAYVEQLRLTSAGASNGTGNTLNNVIYAGGGDNVMNGGTGTDTVSYIHATAGVTASLATVAAQATGGSGSDTLLNFEGLTGSNYADALTGNAAANTLNGAGANDTLTGNGGVDVLIGGAGADRFRYLATTDSGITAGARDTISDFNQAQGDLIDVSGIDANAVLAGNQAFSFIGGAAFSGVDATAQLRYDAVNGILYGSTDADNAAEFSISLTGMPALVAADFVL